MNKVLAIILLASSHVYAWQDEYEVDSLSGQKVYESTMGNKYEYDMNNPIDEIRYETDIGAQLRDEMDEIRNPTNEIRQEIERDLGQYGRGIYND